ncbi:hypothetical protein Nepgr_021431 [Nepenthes gracilis]|uniref:Uncharacterized protein n=1 Tax=Nepenthes gracilis TaxID=150966 RepID=A0AAD3XX76_NEPGR|nr:hypothetical protein Nepgr_021431 [Nepenthes gracilis]
MFWDLQSASNVTDFAPASDLASLRLISHGSSEADADRGVVPTSRKSIQDAIPKNLALGEALVGCGAPISMDDHTADDKSQYMNLGHAASCLTSAIDPDPTDADPIDPMEMVLPVDQAKEGHVAFVLKDNLWQANEQLISSKSFCPAHAVLKDFCFCASIPSTVQQPSSTQLQRAKKEQQPRPEIQRGTGSAKKLADPEWLHPKPQHQRATPTSQAETTDVVSKELVIYVMGSINSFAVLQVAEDTGIRLSMRKPRKNARPPEGLEMLAN